MTSPGNLVLGIYTQSMSQSDLTTKPQTLESFLYQKYSCCMQFMVYFFKFQCPYTNTEEHNRNEGDDKESSVLKTTDLKTNPEFAQLTCISCSKLRRCPVS